MLDVMPHSYQPPSVFFSMPVTPLPSPPTNTSEARSRIWRQAPQLRFDAAPQLRFDAAAAAA
ncbi:hypothetical protein EJB05_33485 [Eragrostis curvula]|uniref:Uncharacterized protein n=1 Tax=Eragrostis curvula TaxID=38414 RepID=A0A5J9U1X9_9POAL|nr:hypothetical protein EJB05_33485 [Eragrostis curvula]